MSRFLWTGIGEQGIQETGAIGGHSAVAVTAELNRQGKFRISLRRLSDYAVQQNLGEEILHAVLSFLGRLLGSGINLHLSLNEAIQHFKPYNLNTTSVWFVTSFSKENRSGMRWRTQR